MAFPRTPVRSGEELYELIDSLNRQFALELPNPRIYSPSLGSHERSIRWRCYNGIKRLYFNRNIDLNVVLNNFEDWVVSRQISDEFDDSSRAYRSKLRTRPRESRLNLGYKKNNNAYGRQIISQDELDERLKYLMSLIDDEIYLLNRGTYSPYAIEKRQGIINNALLDSSRLSGPSKRRFSDDDDDDEGEFHTAPNSPEKDPDFARSPKIRVDDSHDLVLGRPFWNGLDATNNNNPTATGAALRITAKTFGVAEKEPSKKLVQQPTGTESFLRRETMDTTRIGPGTSFSTVTTSYITSFGSTRLNSFNTSVTDLTQPMDSQSMYDDSITAHLISEDMKMNLEEPEKLDYEYLPPEENQGPTCQEIMDELLTSGPFSVEHPFKSSISLRYRYELERIGRAWKVPLSRMLVGNNISFKTHEEFWEWIAGHNQRGANPLPGKCTRRAWDSAMGDFKTDRHSEVVVLTGNLDWCNESEPGILKLNLNPLKVERTCRFHRRFGSDRFLSLTVPAPSRPPRHLRPVSQPALLRESIAMWLTQNDHRCLGRVWRPFYVEEVKAKRRSQPAEPRFRVEFFAVDGVDFDHSLLRVPAVAPAKEDSDRHTPMALESLINWHMPQDANADQSNCKLFQRFSLGLSKTFATVVLKPTQVLYLKDVPGRPVMNDGCALMSRSLANEICDSLGISGNTPSCFQGRIAGAKGLWMVDRHQSSISGDDDFWIQISDSQLKIKPHPQFWEGPVDDEQLTFEVVNWSKPLHSVDLNIQLLAILEHGGRVKEYIAELTRTGIQALYQDFAEVLLLNSNLLCRSLVQKLRPVAEISSAKACKGRRLEQWMADEAESIIRFSEAGFQPQQFYPLRRRLGKYLKYLLDRHVNELRIEVPLSTYAFCIADPYGVLREDEVHFGFSNQWRDQHGQFEDNLLDGVDVLVGRLPAHVPSDIERRRAVWKPELRHFKDVIVFPTRGDIPLAHMLSGGDYDGDTPWICWDPNIVMNFRNSDLPEESFTAEHYGLTKHSVPMKEVQSTDGFLHGAFLFNLTLSNLGRCTVEHEKIAYDESIDSDKAKELACLLSHLVDGRKGGVHLSEKAWQQYRKTISPKQRQLPAYKNSERKHKPSNIIDYLKFEVAEKEKRVVLEQLERSFPETESINSKDEDLIRPWNEAWKIAETEKRECRSSLLLRALTEITTRVDEFKTKWARRVPSGERAYGPIAQEAVTGIQTLPPPRGDHPLLHTWQNSPDEWRKVLASCTYKKYPHSSFVLHAFGETLCQIKTASCPSRTVTNDILACYKFSRKMVQHLTARELGLGHAEEGDDGDDEYEGQEAIEEMLGLGGVGMGMGMGMGMVVPGGYDYYDYDFDDGGFVE